MQMMEKSINFDKCALTLSEVIKNIGEKKGWPKNNKNIKIVYVYSHHLANEVEKTINSLLEKYTIKEIAYSIKSPKTIWKLILDCTVGMRQEPAQWNINRRKNLIQNLLLMLQYIKEDDYYYENQTNKLIKRFDKELIEKKSIKSDKIPYFKSLLWLFCESLYYFVHNLGIEIHGPYIVNEKTYLVHDFYNLKPIDLRPELNELNNLKINSIKIITEYKDLKIAFDAFNNYYVREGSFVDYEKVWVLINNEIVDENKMNSVIHEIENIYDKSTKISNDLTGEQVVSNKVKFIWYQLKPWKDMLNQDWKPNFDLIQKDKIRYKSNFLDYLNVSKELSIKDN